VKAGMRQARKGKSVDPRHDTPEFRRIRKIRYMANELDSMGGWLSGLGEYVLANKVWATASILREKAINDTQELYKSTAAGKIRKED
jgi:hypothetical protein